MATTCKHGDDSNFVYDIVLTKYDCGAILDIYVKSIYTYVMIIRYDWSQL